MDKKELENILKAEIILAAKKLISSSRDTEWNEAVKQFEKVYKKIAAYQYLQETEEKNWESLFVRQNNNRQTVSSDNRPVTNNKKEESPETGKADTGRNPLQKHAETFKKVTQTKFEPKNTGNYPPLSIGIADKIAFSQHLFDKNPDLLQQFVSEINTVNDFGSAMEIFMAYKEKLGWQNKEEYEERLKQLIQAKFSK